MYADGSQVKQPKGLCELQGYVYDAKTRMAEAFQALGDEARAKALLEQAETLKQKFNEAFWMKDEGCFAYGLDPLLLTSVSTSILHFRIGYLISSYSACALVPAPSHSASGARVTVRAGKYVTCR
ncbi:MAG: hypothetical protein E6I91_11600 [Chloroflexi bacterium]|nr:MAG: hypothetical protein E6I91_11600 [Chloroflexota bacterium]